MQIADNVDLTKIEELKAKKFEIPDSIKEAVSKLPTPEAIKVIEDFSKAAAFIVDNNNNNNAKRQLTQNEIAQKVSSMSPEQLQKVLDILGPEG